MVDQGQAFDYVVVGAGSAGCALAGRLAEDGGASILVLEAGGSDRSLWVKMPIGYGKTFYHPRLNWRYYTDGIDGLGKREVYCPRGKVLGGSSSINAMVFIRGQREDYDGWAARGNPGWSYAELLPLFRRMENNLAGADEWRGTGGPLAVTTTDRFVHPTCRAFIAAGAELGLPRNPDFNGASQEGVGLYQVTIDHGVRASSAAAFLRPAMRLHRVAVETEAFATKVLVKGARAVGVAYEKAGRPCLARARRAVILSAGTINTPQLLQLSGIGDPALLAAQGIEVVRALPGVGEALQDHVGIDYIYRATRPTLNSQLGTLGGQAALGLRYLFTRGGPLALSVNQAGGFVRSDQGRSRPNLQLYFSPMSYVRSVPGKRELLRPDPFPGFLLGISNCHPTSRGHVRIRSADPRQAPAIQPNYLATEEDIRELVDGVRLLRRLAGTKALSALIAEEIAPGPATQAEDELIADIRARASSIFHPCGTCAMGPDPARAVVDHELKVHGIDGLRIADASIFPALPAGNINAAAMLVGQKAADMILGED
ncbi:GMC family oxidoreductase [Solirhodobacter olei]|uniref:GMC family oxidoreductase n=1 Tax=Solirhodobacter olei TaxID=2493082 RepID=UPI000FD993BE|nr:GMC family oxidoreductase N-terminal domain-containing protein [Solirhodobacter olei]